MEYVLSFERVAERRGMRKGKTKWLKKGREEGREEGIEEGIEKVKKTALRMLEDGFEIEMISKYTDLPVEEIKKLAPKEN